MQKSLLLVNPTVLEIFYKGFVQKAPSFGKTYSTRNILPRFWWKAQLLVNPTVLETFYQVFVQKALVLANPTVLEMFYQGFDEKPNFW